MCYKINYLQGWRVLSAGVDMAEKLSLCSYMPVSQFVVKKWCLSAYRCSVYEAFHLRKVECYRGKIAHLPKVRTDLSERSDLALLWGRVNRMLLFRTVLSLLFCDGKCLGFALNRFTFPEKLRVKCCQKWV